jgi:hypothetical protein
MANRLPGTTEIQTASTTPAGRAHRSLPFDVTRDDAMFYEHPMARTSHPCADRHARR